MIPEPKNLTLRQKLTIITQYLYDERSPQQIATYLSMPLDKVNGYIEYLDSYPYDKGGVVGKKNKSRS